MSTEPVGSHIQNALELDVFMRTLERNLQYTSSPLKKFLLISEGYAQVRHLPEVWLSSYLHVYATYFPKLIQHPDISVLAPTIWDSALALLRFITAHDWLSDDESVKDAFATALEKAIFSFACVGAIEELHTLLKEHVPDIPPLEREALNRIYAVGSDEFTLFTAYMKEVTFGGFLREAIDAAHRRWINFRDQENAVSIALLEDDGNKVTTLDSVAGRILSLEIRKQKTGMEIQLENHLDDTGTDLIQQLRIAQQVASEFVRERLNSDVLSSHKLSIPHTATVVGRSLALSSAVGMVCLTSEELNRRIRWRMKPSVLCIGSLTEAGVIEESPLQVLMRKIQLVFFSPVTKVVIHTQQTVFAHSEVQRLRNRYPNRNLEIIGVTTLQDCFDRTGIVEEEIRSPLVRATHVVKKHALAIAGTGILILLLIAGYLWYQAYYDYPNLEFTLETPIGLNAIVHNLKDSLEWCFRDGQQVKEAVVPFGDIEIGDGFTRNFWIWNLTPRDDEVEIVLEGRDSSDWYINCRGGNQRLPAKEALQMSVMFTPLSEGRDKRASLVIREADSKEELYRIHFKGASGAPEPAGYALRLDGEDDEIYFGDNATVFDAEEATFECWIRPLSRKRGVLIHNGKNLPDEADRQNFDVAFWSLDTLFVVVGSFIRLIPLPQDAVLDSGRWTHLAVAYSVPKSQVQVTVDGSLVLDEKVEFFIQGRTAPHVSIGARDDGQEVLDHVHADLDEIRFWHTFRSDTEIRRDMARTISGSTKDLHGYWNFDMDAETSAFTATSRSEDGKLLGRPSLVRSDIPEFEAGKIRSHVSKEDAGIVLAPFEYLQCSRNPLPQICDATYALWFKPLRTDTVSYFAIVNLGHYLELRGRTLDFNKQDFPVQYRLGEWNLFVYRSTKDGDADLFLNGGRVGGIAGSDIPVDRNHRFEGIQLGFFNDKFNHFGAKYYPWKHRSLVEPREFRSFAVWDRVLSEGEIMGMAVEELPPEAGLEAYWDFSEKDLRGGFEDRVRGARMLIKHVEFWKIAR